MSKESVFSITNTETGEKITLELLGYTNIEHKVYAVCTPHEKSGTDEETLSIVILRIRESASGEKLFTIVEDKKYCKIVYDAFTGKTKDEKPNKNEK